MLANNTPEICDQLVELHRERQDLHRAEKSMTLRIKAKCRRLCGGDKAEAERLYKAVMGKGNHSQALIAAGPCAPFIAAREQLETQRKQTEKRMTEQAKQLPVAPWVESVRGIGMLSLASIVGESGDLSNYPTVAKLWKRMGLAVIHGERQRRKQGAEAVEHGYSPARRSVMWVIGDAMFRAGGYYADLCRERKQIEVDKAEAEGLIVAPSTKKTSRYPETYRTHGHIHNRAKRYMEKRLLRDLWRAWRDASHGGYVGDQARNEGGNDASS